MIVLHINGGLFYFGNYICSMRYIIFLLTLFLLACGNNKSKTIAGNYLILYPDHILPSQAMEEAYEKMQDSIVSGTGLKLVQLNEDGNFFQMDSSRGGKWADIRGSRIFIKEAGKGLDSFNTRLISFEDDMLVLRQQIPVDDDSILLDWNFKKITGKEYEKLFAKDFNVWREKPTAVQTDEQIKEKLISMLNYYSLYWKLVSEEASYFVPARVMLPFRYYQDGMNLKFFDAQSYFANCFYNEANAKTAYYYLVMADKKCEAAFPKEKTYTLEYSKYMKQLAEAIKSLRS